MKIEAAYAAGPNLILQLDGGRGVTVPFEWYPRLTAAPAEQRANLRIIGDGAGINWPDVDEDLSLAGILQELRSRGLLAW